MSEEDATSPEPSWRRAAMSQKDRFEHKVDLQFTQGITVHATQNIDTGSCIWDAALVLGSYLANLNVFPEKFWHNKKVCEIGSGCGVTGIVAGHLGAQVVLTELGDEMSLLQTNFQDNPVQSAPCSNSTSEEAHKGYISCREFFWGEDASHLNPPFDVILAADCVYEVQLFDALVKALVDITDRNTITYFCIEHRWQDVEQWWWKEVNKHFKVTMIDRSQHGEFNHPKIDIYELKRVPPRPGRG